MQQPGRAAEIKAIGIGKSFGSFRALDNLSLNIGRGEFLTLLGPSGSGKTTFLMILAGFVQPTEGKLFSDGTDITDRPAEQRAAGMRTFWTVFVPMTRSGIIGSALIVFVFSLGFFVTPAILGGGRSVMIAELIYLRIFQSPDWGLGAAISVVLVLFVGALMALLFRYVRPKQLI